MAYGYNIRPTPLYGQGLVPAWPETMPQPQVPMPVAPVAPPAQVAAPGGLPVGQGRSGGLGTRLDARFPRLGQFRARNADMLTNVGVALLTTRPGDGAPVRDAFYYGRQSDQERADKAKSEAGLNQALDAFYSGAEFQSLTPDEQQQIRSTFAANPEIAGQFLAADAARMMTPAAPRDPMTVAAGTDVIDPVTHEVLYRNEPAPELFGPIITGEQATAMGLDPAKSWQQGPDRQWHQAGTGPQTVITSERAYDAETGKQDATFRGEIYAAETNAYNQLNTFSVMEQLMNDPNFYSGVLAEPVAGLRRFFGAIGLADPQSAVAIENFGALANEAVLKALGGTLGAQISNTDRLFLERTVPNLTFSEPGNRTLLAIQRAVANRNIEVAALAREYAARPGNNGRIDDGFRAELAQWTIAHPLFPDGNIPGVGSAPTPRIADPTQQALPSGAALNPALGTPAYHNPEAGIIIYGNP